MPIICPCNQHLSSFFIHIPHPHHPYLIIILNSYFLSLLSTLILNLNYHPGLHYQSPPSFPFLCHKSSNLIFNHKSQFLVLTLNLHHQSIFLPIILSASVLSPQNHSSSSLFILSHHPKTSC